MKTQLTLALLAAMIDNANANGNGGGNETSEAAKLRRFNEFAAKYNKQYNSAEELGKRKKEFEKNENAIAALNKKNKDVGENVRFAINATGDLSEEEFRQSQGLDTQHIPEKPSAEEIEQALDEKNAGIDGGRRRMQDYSLDWSHLAVDWVGAGKTTAVKNQGGCGSCWAFAATTAQESLQSIFTGRMPSRLSEQECVDCDANSQGCMGGWPYSCWHYSQTYGSMSAGDYPYVGVDQDCLVDQTNKVIASKVSLIGHLPDNPLLIAQDLKLWGPNVIYVAAGNDCWRWYSSGILSSAHGCPTGADHAVTLVGLYSQGSGQPYWKIQNSWGSGWGEDGFIYMWAEGDVGISGMNLNAMWVLTDVNYPDRCRIDEWYQPEFGESYCYDDLQCRGNRTCHRDFAYGLGTCQGEHNCQGINY